ncbi:MAG: DUF5915 domain-containing protein, partial [Cyclobacteriaceae bacterium]|nr:DUF5915 domain-containing protein [Cyclobacteriaceae bacterium]
SRYWGTPLPIWTTEDRTEQKCIGSINELKEEVEKSISTGFMENSLPEDFDLHRPYVDDIVLTSDSGKPMYREKDLIDVWFDSGAMPYAQWHYPFENEDVFKNSFPADFIAEGVDQTRGWFFTLHAIAGLLFDGVAFKNVIANGLVLDKDGNKMSKRLGNAIDPFKTLEKYGADATRWYMISNANPWDNLKFNLEGVEEVQRRFFGTLHNTYSFFALYANLDQFQFSEDDIPLEQRTESDRWILSKVNTLIKQVEEAYDDYEPTKAARAIQDFTIDDLSNWYVRLNRKRFWKGEYSTDKISAYQTLYTCLETIARLSSPVAPFYMERLYHDLNNVTGKIDSESIHLTSFPEYNPEYIDTDLEEMMTIAQKISSLVHSLRKKDKLKVRQPLSKILVPVINQDFQRQVQHMAELIKNEVNIKEIEYVGGEDTVLVKSIKPNFRRLGQLYGANTKNIAKAITEFVKEDIDEIEERGEKEILIEGEKILLTTEDVEIAYKDIPGWSVASEGRITIALDITVNEELRREGFARDIVNRVQNIRKENGFEVQDKINIVIKYAEPIVKEALSAFNDYVCTETQAKSLILEESSEPMEIDIDGVGVSISVEIG